MLNAQHLPDPALPWPIAMAGVELIADSEQGPGGGVALVAYKCPAGVWTCGWGETEGVGPKTRWTKAYADQRLCDSIAVRADAIQQLCTVPTTANQLAALVSLAYNIGQAALAKSSVLRAHNRGDHAAAARAFGLWNKASVGGKLTVLPGLVTRRAREAALYLTPDVDAMPSPMPQAVAAESPISRSPIATSGAVTAATGVFSALSGGDPSAAPAAPAPGAVAVLEQAGQAAGTVQTAVQGIKALAVDTIGIPASWWLPLILVVAGGTAAYWRWRQRRDGWA